MPENKRRRINIIWKECGNCLHRDGMAVAQKRCPNCGVEDLHKTWTHEFKKGKI